MKIAFGFDIFYPETNGVITSTLNLANNLIELGHEVVFFIPDEKEYTDTVLGNGIKLIHVKAVDSFIYKGLKVLPYNSGYLNEIFVAENIDVVHITSPWLICVALSRSARRNKVPVLYTHHTLINDPIYINYFFRNMTLAKMSTSAIWKIVFDPIFKLIWEMTAPSKNTCKELKNHIKKDIPIKFISNGIDVSAYENKKTLEIPKVISDFGLGNKTFLYIGRLGYEKGIGTLLEGFTIFHKKFDDAKLIIIGKGPAQKDIEKLILKDSLEKSVLLAGYLEHEAVIKSDLLNSVNSFVTASLSENQSMTIIEALCSGVVCICADVPNMTDLANKESAYYFKPGDSFDLAQIFERAYTNIDEVKLKRIEAKKNIERFDGRNVALEFEKEYLSILQKKAEGFFIPRNSLAKK